MSTIEHVSPVSEFITIPDTVLPSGLAVPSFKVGKYLSTRGENDTPLSIATAAPWVEINYHDAIAAADKAGLKLLRESQALAIAWLIYQQDANWTGGKVGEGQLFQGLHEGNVDEAQPGTYESDDANERRWHALPNGERIYDFAGVTGGDEAEKSGGRRWRRMVEYSSGQRRGR